MTFREAQKEAQKFLQPINDVEEGIEHAEKTMNQLITQWREAIKPNLKRSTQESYEWAFKRIERAFGRWRVAEIEKADVQAFLTNASEALSGKSVRNLRAHLSGVLSAAEDWGWIRKGGNPAKGRLRLPEAIQVRVKRVLRPNDFQKLLMVLAQPYRTLVLLAVLSGLRKGELAALRWEDLQPGHVIVDEAVYRGDLGTPKTRKSRRPASIGPITEAALKEWRQMAEFTGPKDFVFAIRTNTPIDLHNAVARHIKPACVKLGIPEVSWHDLRHTYTTWGRKAGIQAESMRDQLGHASVLMTLDVYSHVDNRDAMAARIEQYAWAEQHPGLM